MENLGKTCEITSPVGFFNVLGLGMGILEEIDWLK